MGKLVSSFLGHLMPGVIRPLQVLWNEMLGFLFLVLAVCSIPSAVRGFRAFDGDAGGLFKIILILSFMFVMAYLGLAAFLKARKIGRS